jgi:hypothetical protein
VAVVGSDQAAIQPQHLWAGQLRPLSALGWVGIAVLMVVIGVIAVYMQRRK